MVLKRSAKWRGHKRREFVSLGLGLYIHMEKVCHISYTSDKEMCWGLSFQWHFHLHAKNGTPQALAVG